MHWEAGRTSWGVRGRDTKENALPNWPSIASRLYPEDRTRPCGLPSCRGRRRLAAGAPGSGIQMHVLYQRKMTPPSSFIVARSRGRHMPGDALQNRQRAYLPGDGDKQAGRTVRVDVGFTYRPQATPWTLPRVCTSSPVQKITFPRAAP